MQIQLSHLVVFISRPAPQHCLARFSISPLAASHLPTRDYRRQTPATLLLSTLGSVTMIIGVQGIEIQYLGTKFYATLGKMRTITLKNTVQTACKNHLGPILILITSRLL